MTGPDDLAGSRPPERSLGLRIAALCAAVFAFVVGLIVFTMLMAAGPAMALVLVASVAVGLFAARRRFGASPILGAMAIGVGVAVVVFGACIAIMMGQGLLTSRL